MALSGFFAKWLPTRLSSEPHPKSSRASAQEDKSALKTRAGAKINPDFEAGYLRLQESGELKRRGEELWKIMESCRLCPRECGANRLKGEEGFCGSTSRLEISAYHPHFGEERSLVGEGGSGTIFLTHCGLRCVFCINWEISQGGRGSVSRLEGFAENLLKDTYVNIMSQYRPMHKAFNYPEISRRLKRQEYEEAVRWAKEAGLTNLDIQGW